MSNTKMSKCVSWQYNVETILIFDLLGLIKMLSLQLYLYALLLILKIFMKYIILKLFYFDSSYQDGNYSESKEICTICNIMI